MKYTGGEAFVEVLKRQGVKAIFSSPGTEWAPVWETLARLKAQGNEEIAYFNCRHEELAVSAAIGYAQKGGGVPVVLLHTSAGLLHGSMAIRGAHVERVPMLICAGESARFTENDDPERGLELQWLHLTDVGGTSRMAASFVKWSQAVTSRETLSPTVARACRMARMAPRGPVFLAVPGEFMQDEREEEMPRIPAPQACSAPYPADVERVAALLRGSENPVLITERVGLQPPAVPKLVALAEALALPVFESKTQFAVNFPKEHPLHAGFDVGTALSEADVVLVVAATTPWDPQHTTFRPDAKVVFIDDQALCQQYPFWNYGADLILEADPLLALEALVETVQAAGPVSALRPERFAKWRAKHDHLLVSWDQGARAAQHNKPIDPDWLCYAINEWLPPEAIVVRETITHTGAVTRHLRRIGPGNFYKGNIGGLGSGMGLALGAKIASRNQPVIHLVGDGSFNYAPVLSALGFSQEYRQPVLTVVFNNGAYRAMQGAHLGLYPDGWASRTNTFYGVHIAPNPDYAQLLKAFDGYGEKVEDPQEIVPALGRAWAEIQKGRPALLDVILGC